MCWEMDYYWLAEQKKAEETKAKQEQRSEVIEKLLSEANKQPEKSDETPAKETIRRNSRSPLPACGRGRIAQ